MKKKDILREDEKKISEIKLRFDHRDELKRVIQGLELEIEIFPSKSIIISSSEEEERRNKKALDRALVEIDSAQQKYLSRLQSAYESGDISENDYNRARFDASFFGPFSKLKQKVRDFYVGK